MIVFEKPERFRGTIEVYEAGYDVPGDLDDDSVVIQEFEWRWRCKSNNHTILASGQGYNRKAGALNAIDAQYSARWVGKAFPRDLVVPWRLVMRDRHGDITTTGAVY